MKEKAKILIIKILLRMVYKLYRLNPHDLLLAREISAWQDIYDSKAPTVFPRPLYPQKGRLIPPIKESDNFWRKCLKEKEKCIN